MLLRLTENFLHLWHQASKPVGRDRSSKGILDFKHCQEDPSLLDYTTNRLLRVNFSGLEHTEAMGTCGRI